MSYLVRQARASVWNGAENVTAEQRTHALASFARREEDTDGVSVYEVQDESQVRLVVAALVCRKRERGKLDLLHLEEEDIRRFGAATPCEGDTPVPRANALHRVLDWPSAVLTALVEHLLAVKKRATRYQPRDVLEAVFGLDPNDIDNGSCREWVLEWRRSKGA